MSSRDAPIDRPTARVLLLDRADRLLLFASAMPDGTSPGRLWAPPGGALETGETWEQAAHREVLEETELDVPIGPCVWLREHVWFWASRGHWYRSIERYFVARTDATDVGTRGWTPEERVAWEKWHWWTVDELTATQDVVVPRQLAELLPPLLAGHHPATPMVVR